jgi:hypothetical protein
MEKGVGEEEGKEREDRRKRGACREDEGEERKK